jgi:hypothetical protein
MISKDGLKFLNNSYEHIATWIRFADQKIAILMAFDALVLTTISQIHVVWFKYILIGFILLSLVFLLMALLARLEPPFSQHINTENCYYFGSIAGMTSAKFKDLLIKDKIIEQDSVIPINYIEQIISNSKIATRKFQFFNYAVYINIIALIFSVIAFLTIIIAFNLHSQTHNYIGGLISSSV